MKYIRTRDQFLNLTNETLDLSRVSEYIKSSEMISEAMENDITWGGSLLGRLINSVIRKAKIGYNSTKIDSIVENVKIELDLLLSESLESDKKSKLNLFKIQGLIYELSNSVNNGDKLKIFLGNGNKGLIDSTIEEIEKTPEFTDGKLIIDKLTKFKNDLLQLTEDENDTITEEPVKEPVKSIVNTVEVGSKLLQSIVDIHNDIKGNYVIINKQVVNKVNKIEHTKPKPEETLESVTISVDKEEQSVKAWEKVVKYHNTSQISSYIPQIIKLLSEKNEKIISDISKQIIMSKNTIGKPMEFSKLVEAAIPGSDITQSVSKSISIFSIPLLAFLGDESLLHTYSEAGDHILTFIKSFTELENSVNENISYINESDDQNADNVNGESDEETNTEISPELGETISSNKDEISKSWKKHFTPDEISKWSLTNDKIKKSESEFEKSKIDINTQDSEKSKPTIDHIIKICDLFGDAYNVYATSRIPSGRPKGKVSEKTMREYTYIGKGSSSQDPENPGYGPWAVKSIYDKWKKGIMNILKDTKYRDILASDNITINGKKAAGKDLMTFMNSLLSKNKGDYDENREELIKEYYMLSKKLTHAGGSEKKIKVEDIGDGKNLQWITRVNTPKSLFYENGILDNTFIVLSGTVNTKDKDGKTKSTKRNFISYTMTFKKNEKILFFKFQKTSKEFIQTYLSEDGVTIEAAGLPNLKTPDKTVYVGMAKIENDIKFGSKIKIAYIDVLKDVNNDKNITVEELTYNNMKVLSHYIQGENLPTPYKKTNIKKRPTTDKSVESKNYIKLMDKLK